MAGNIGGAFTGLYQGSSGASDAAAALKPLLPNVSVYQQGASTAPALQTQVTTPAQTYAAGGNLTKFGHFLGGLASETGHLVEGATSWLAHSAATLATAPVHLGQGIYTGLEDRNQIASISKQSQQITGKLSVLHDQFKSGKITAAQYKSGVKSLGVDSSNLDKQSSAMINKVTLDQKATTKALIDTAAGLVTIMTAGFGGEALSAVGIEDGGLSLVAKQSAADYLASAATKPILDPVIATIQRVASNPEVFKSLDAGAQEALQRSTAEVVAQAGARLTSGQIARATAANVALKYPIYFNYMSTSANQVYQELDQAKYGEAVRTVAFNAALLLSGGPIGQALKYGGKAVTGVSERTFGQTSFWDELSKFYGTQETNGFASSISKMAQAIENPTERAEFVKNLAAVEATNVAATGGDAIAAAARVAKGMQGTYSFDLTAITHEAAVQDMVKFAKNYRLANEIAESKNLGNLAVGRVDARDLNKISAYLNTAADAPEALQRWESLKQSFPNQAWANNDNFDRQIRDIISTHAGEPAEIDAAIHSVRAQFSVPGFPESVAKTMAKDGYFPIKPKNLEAPFKEGAEKLITAHAGNEDFFMKSVQPLPVLGSVGALFTKLGLSPNASTQQVYGYFNDYLAKNLEESGVIGKTNGEELHQTSDLLIKKLSDYAHTLKIPVTDMRMLTNKQIRAALGVEGAEATSVQNAISKAYVQIPLAVRGLGDAAVDWTYNLPVSAPIARRYLKIQGALRFSFNPFFQYMRVIPKTEMLTEAKGGGYISSIFQGRASQIEDIRQGLRKGGLLEEYGFLEEPGHIGNVTGGEAVDYAGFGGKNLSRKLLPMQERSIAGLIDAQAQRMGMQWQEYVMQFPHETADTIQAIAGYSRNANFINSPLARTLNIAIFPFRFDAKVAGVFAHSLADKGLVTQVAVINGMMQAHAFLNSPQGQAWYSQNSEAIGLFKYITPLASINEAFQSLLPGHDHSLGNFGELGGLPFGWIPQILDSEGLTHFNQTGTDAKTGDAFPHYIPVTARGQTAVAAQDFLSMLFSYPGAEIGLPSKTSFTHSFASGLVGSHSSDFNKIIPPLTSQQQQYQQNVQQTSGTAPTPPNYQAQSSGTTFVAPTSEPVDLASKLRANAKAVKKKKGDFVPVPAPGQSALGVL